MIKTGKSILSQSDKNKISDILNNGGVVAYPTDTVWGLGADPTNEEGVKKIYELKKRDGNKPLILMASSLEYLKPFIKELSDIELDVLNKYLPGALTLITKKSELTKDFVTSGFDTVGIRIPNHPVFWEVADCSPCKVLATTSANLSTQPSSLKKENVIKYFGNNVNFVTNDFGYYAENIESTIIKYENGWHVLREGVIKIG
ncbi:MAG: threonylcarbamoyl-AMP synthase [Candidatus Gastranaerophilales bacterium]|nr:threonylcarbamoyl-AMP synthase [Candidatus Gastranaerophilales bacterium]